VGVGVGVGRLSFYFFDTNILFCTCNDCSAKDSLFDPKIFCGF